MISRQYSHPKYIRWFKNIFVILAFVFPAYWILNSISRFTPNNFWAVIVDDIVFSPLIFIVLLTSTYYFGQDVLVDEEGLQIEFLWKKMRVRWVDIIETKATFGSLFASEKNCPLIILVNGLTPFHRIFGVLYGLSIKPGFVIFPSISDFQGLKENIQSHIKR